jgi:exosortase A
MAMSVESLGEHWAPLPRARSRFSVVVGLATCLLVVSGLYWQTAWSMVDTWVHAETYSHGFVVVPAFLWFVWKRSDSLRTLPIRPWLPGLIGFALAAGLWLLGELGSVVGTQQFALIAMIICSIVGLLGFQWGRQLALPLVFLFFAVPFGAVFVQTMMDWTADFTALALRLSGVPVFREGTLLVIPSGSWSVIEACSGIRYLISSLMVGLLMAIVMFRSPMRRVAVIAASAVVPVGANWLRAYMIVMIGHLSSNRLAIGVDHLVYGWLLFGLITVLLIAVAARWREDGDDIASGSTVGNSVPARPPINLGVAVALLLVFATGALAAAKVLAPSDVDHPVILPSIPAQGDWREETSEGTRFRPDIKGASAELHESFVRRGKRVNVYVAVYRDQHQDAELVGSGNELLHSGNPLWRVISRGERSTGLTQPAVARSTLVATGDQRFAVWHWYWLAGRTATSDVTAKIDLALRRLFLRGDTQAWVMISTPVETTRDAAEGLLSEFAAQMAEAIAESLRAADGSPP